jgi:5-(carboxyamino)imidazole ribonucleotide synthase
MQIFDKNKTVLGILGGGQLGRMFIQEALSLDMHIAVLDPDPKAPCSLLANTFVQGNFKDFDTVLNFGRSVDLLTIEIEQVNVDALFQLESEGVAVFPQPAVIKIIQDKALQKQFFIDHQIPTSEFRCVEGKSEVEILDAHWFPCFMKSRKDGYDGKGVQFLKSKQDVSLAFETSSIVEKAVHVKLEFSVIIASNGQNEIAAFPPVDMEFDEELNLVEILSAPSKLHEDVQQEALRISRKIIQALGIRGILAIEFFLTHDGEVLVNELAPRPHNSGHHTIEGNITSQFEQHFRAIMGWPLGDTRTIMPAVMVNLLGEEGFSGIAKYEGIQEVLAIAGVYLHLYGKKETRPNRKMGHATIIAPDSETAHRNAQLVKKYIRIIS